MENLNKKQKIILIIIIICIIIFISIYIIKKINNSNSYISMETEEIERKEENIDDTFLSEDKKKNEIVIHITGAVVKEGIVKVENGSRISDVIEKAGGITENADLSKINLAYIVEDGQKIYVPRLDDEDDVTTVKDDAGEQVIKEDDNKSSFNKVNINTATQTELETLNGIGTSTALKIINYRNESGNFKKIEDIKNVPGIGDSKFESIKEYISVK